MKTGGFNYTDKGGKERTAHLTSSSRPSNPSVSWNLQQKQLKELPLERGSI